LADKMTRLSYHWQPTLLQPRSSATTSQLHHGWWREL